MTLQEQITTHQNNCEKLMETLPHGPWKQEPHRVEFKHKNLQCLLSRNPWSGAWCGYVGVPPGHPAYEKSYLCVMSYDISVHGGLTYGEECHGNICHEPAPKTDGANDRLWWLGFDCMHLGDMYPASIKLNEEMRKTYPMFKGLINEDTYKDLEFVTNEVKNLAEQLSEMKNVI